jgi:Tol biopolymer transport system component
LSHRSGSDQIWTVRRDGSGPQQLTEHPQGLLFYGWSPDGARMVTGRLIFDPRTPWKSQMPQELPSWPGEQGGKSGTMSQRFSMHAWSPDGKWLAGNTSGDNDQRAVAVYSLSSHTYRRLTEYWGGVITWLNDSRRLLFTTTDRKIAWLDIQSAKVQLVFSAPGEILSHPSISRDGHTIYFERGAVEGDIWMVTLK